MKKFFDFLYRLFFTREDDLDSLQVLFAAIVIVTLVIAWHVTTGLGINDAVKIEGMITLRWLTGLLVITAVPKWLVPFISSHKTDVDKQIFTPPTNDPLNSEYHAEQTDESRESFDYTKEERT